MAYNNTAIDTEVVVGWSSIRITSITVAIQFIVCYAFFICKRKIDAKPDNKNYDLYEPRQYAHSHRSPPPFEQKWYMKVWQLSDAETLRMIGLDSYMFLRLLRFGARITALGSVLSVILIPVYATGTARGNSTEGFNLFTLARVENGDEGRLGVTLAMWYIFIAFILHELNHEWETFASHRHKYLANGDEDVPLEFRYSVLCEQVPEWLQNERVLKKYFERMFPDKVASTVTCMEVRRLENLVNERYKVLCKLEQAEAYVHAAPGKKRPQVRAGGTMGCCGGERYDAIEHFKSELIRLNKAIDYERALVPAVAAHVRAQRKHTNQVGLMDVLGKSLQLLGGKRHVSTTTGEEDGGVERIVLETATDEANEPLSSPLLSEDENLSTQHPLIARDRNGFEDIEFTFSDDEDSYDYTQENDGVTINPSDIIESKITPTSTAIVTFTNLRAKQAAAQCALTGNSTSMQVFHAPDPRSILWENITTPLPIRETSRFGMKIVWGIGILFWAIPVSFVNSLANLNNILEAFHFETVDPNLALYGFASGLVPVIVLAIIMEVLYIIISFVAKKVVRLKSLSDVDAYCTYWHQLYQFANLWILVIGGSIFNQLNTLFSDPESIIDTVANAMPGSSVFFVNMILTQSLGKCAMDLCMISKFGVNLVKHIIRSEKMLTQRQIDDSKTPDCYRWGYEIPKIFFIFMVVILYCPIVPIMEFFGFVYFSGRYIIYKHQFLHVNAQVFEGGGNATWLSIFNFMIAIIYMGEAVFIAYMGLKQSPVVAALGFLPLAATILLHLYWKQNIIKFLENLPLQTAATLDINYGEHTDFNSLVYLEPVLNANLDERHPCYVTGDYGEFEFLESAI